MSGTKLVLAVLFATSFVAGAALAPVEADEITVADPHAGRLDVEPAPRLGAQEPRPGSAGPSSSS